MVRHGRIDLDGSGLLRAFGELEKCTGHYLQDHWFIGKMALFTMVILQEPFPMIILIRWRAERKRGNVPDLSSAPLLARLKVLQVPILLLIVFMAAAMARGL